jgi:hypothetical protein
VTFVTLQVREAFKGARPGRFTFMQVGHAGDTPPPAGPRFMLIPDLPTYRPGEEVLLFLYPATGTGLTSPVDGRQGKHPLLRDARTGETKVVEGVLTAAGAPRTLPLATMRERLRAAVAAAANEQRTP